MSDQPDATGATPHATSPIAPPAKARLLFIDVARTTAIVLVVINHGLITFKVNDALPVHISHYIRCVTSAATPAFMILFGIMLEVVAFARLSKAPHSVTYRKLAKRSGMCYLGCLALIAANSLQGGMPLDRIVKSALFMDSARYGNILKFYTVALLLAIPLLAIRRRIGILPTILLGISPWLLRPLLSQVPWPGESDPAGYWTALLFGNPASPNARYSVMHGLTFIVVGMGIGRTIKQSVRSDDWALLRRVLLAILALTAVPILAIAITGRMGDALTGYATWYRYNQHPGYYLFGGVSVFIILYAAYLAVPPGAAPTNALTTATLIGRRTLFSYTVSNIIFCLWPYGLDVAPWLGVLLTLAVIILTHLITAAYDASVARPVGPSPTSAPTDQATPREPSTSPPTSPTHAAG